MHQPVCCRREAFEVFAAQMPVLETTDGLLNAATAVSMHALNDVRTDEVRARLSEMAERIRSRTCGSQLQAVLAHLHDVLFDEEGFAGNHEDYYNPLNSFLPAVLDLRLGIPITLTLIYKIVGEVDLNQAQEFARQAESAFGSDRSDVLSIITGELTHTKDSFLESIKEQVEKLSVLTAS